MGYRKGWLSVSVRQASLITLLTVTAFGQICSSEPALRPSLSPLELVSLRSLGNLWNSLGIPAQMRAEGSEIKGGEIDCSKDCEAQIVSGDHVLADGEDALVRVCQQLNHSCRFLLFHLGYRGWGLVDYLDSPHEKYEEPRVSVEASGDRRWVVKTAFAGGGAGAYRLNAEWFEVRCGALKRVLTLPLRGQDLNAKPARSFLTRFKTRSFSGNKESLEFAYIVRFEDGEGSLELWQEERTVVFSRTNPETPFVFDPAASNISSEFVEKVFAFDSMKENDFVECAYGKLMEIARTRTDFRRDWLRTFLVALAPSAKVTELKAQMTKTK